MVAPEASGFPLLSRAQRLTALGTAVGLFAPFVILAFVTPSASGMGTHTSLGLPSCSWPVALGLPCPSCGYTTAATHMAHLHLGSAFVTQPAGALLSVGAIVAAAVALGMAISGRPLHLLFAPLATAKSAWIAAAVALAGWGYKIGSFKGWWP